MPYISPQQEADPALASPERTGGYSIYSSHSFASSHDNLDFTTNSHMYLNHATGPQYHSTGRDILPNEAGWQPEIGLANTTLEPTLSSTRWLYAQAAGPSNPPDDNFSFHTYGLAATSGAASVDKLRFHPY